MTEWFAASDTPNLQGQFVTDTYMPKSAGGKERHTRILCRMKATGSADIVSRRVRGAEGEALMRRFPEAWAAFQGESVEAPDGYPIDDLPGMTPERTQMLRFAGIHTIEQMDAVDESVINRLGFGARDLQRAAHDFLLARKAEAEAAKPKPRRGRPPKEKQEDAE